MRQHPRSTHVGTPTRRCPTCGWPVADCRCAKRFDEAVPQRITAVLRLEKKGHGGKTVTVVGGLPRNAPCLAALARELKRACACGGGVAGDTVEIQGDQRARVRALLQAKGWAVKG
jgi:translation initiation factor 1